VPRRFLLRSILPLLLFAAAPLGLSAQGALPAGRTVTGSISASDPRMSDNTNYDEWTFTAKARRRYRIAMDTKEFDAYLSIGRGRGADYHQLVTDDDGGEGTNALLVWVAPSDGEFIVRANTVREGETGDYEVTLTDAGEPPPLRPVAMTVGQAISGTLSASDQVTGEGRPADYYKFTARAGRRYALTLLSQAFDAMVGMGRGTNGAFDETKSNDDGAGGTNARLEWVTRDAGEVWVSAHAINADTGRYTLLLEDLGDAPPPAAPDLLKTGSMVHGKLEGGDEVDGQSYYDLFYLDGEAGQVVVIRMDSDEFDPILSIGRGDGSEWHELDKDDDGGLATNAHLEFRFPEAGRYIVRAGAVGRNSGGYTIRVE
jgi:hypothetical protein